MMLLDPTAESQNLSVGDRRLNVGGMSARLRSVELCNRYSGGLTRLSKESYRGIQVRAGPRKYCAGGGTL